MKKDSLFIKALILIFIFTFSISISSCAAQKKPAIKKSSASEDEKEPPKELESMKEVIAGIEKTLQALYDNSKKPMILLKQEMEKQGGKEEEKQQEEGENKSSSEEEKKNAEKPPSDEEINMKMEQELYKKMEDIKKDITKLHGTWNTYEPKAVSDLAVQTSITDFEDSLNNLTKSINNRDILQSLLNVNEVYKNLPDFYMLYKTKTPPEVDRVRYAVKKIKLTSDIKDFATANAAMIYLDSVWTVTKPKLKKDNVEVMNKFEFALADLKKALEAQDVMVIEAKADVILDLADEIEKGAEKKSE